MVKYSRGDNWLKEHARKNRHKLTRCESEVKKMFRELKIKVYIQYPISIEYKGKIYNYILDFRGKKEYSNIIIEVDGEYHNTKEQIEYDNKRTDILNYAGFYVYRIKNEEVNNGDAIKKIKKIFKKY